MSTENENYDIISKDQFEFVQTDSKIHDTKFDTKPIGYFKDAFIRFSKNKSSVAAAIIIIILLLFAIIAPIVSHYNYTNKNSKKYTINDGYYSYSRPQSKLFGWLGWDGAADETISISQLDLYNAMAQEQNYASVPELRAPLIKLKKETNDALGGTKYVARVDSYYKIGYEYVNLSYADYFRLQAYQNATGIQVIYPISDYYKGVSNPDLWYKLTDTALEQAYVAHTLNKPEGNVGINTQAAKDEEGNLIPLYLGTSLFNKFDYYSLRLDGEVTYDEENNPTGNYTYVTLDVKKNNAKGTAEVQKNADGTFKTKTEDNNYYQYAVKTDSGYKVRVLYYEYYRYYKTKYSYSNDAVYTIDGKDYTNIDTAVINGYKPSADEKKAVMNGYTFEEKTGFYPTFLFGTDNKGRDLFTLLGSGARLSFILAIAVSAINLTIGAIYGAIEGYYGGTTDMIMERVSDILSGVPFTVVAVLFTLHLADKVGALWSLLFAFVMTGWIGMAARVRMQFYRFKGQEYILSARTLGAKDWRIMFKHIFPNAIGTIITGSVLSIPGVIFSESALSYLHIIDLETSGFTSIGTLLSNASNSKYTLYPYIMFFPAGFIALLEISFNLFGNGLRDAFNPSLRGADD